MNTVHDRKWAKGAWCHRAALDTSQTLAGNEAEELIRLAEKNTRSLPISISVSLDE